MNLVTNLKRGVALTLVVGLCAWFVGCAKETTAPVKPVTNGAPPVKVPVAGSTGGPGAEVPDQSETAKEPTAKSDEKPADAKPEEKPAEEKPAEEKKSDEKPAEEKKSE